MKETFPEMKSESYKQEYILVLRWSVVVLFAGFAIALLVLMISDISAGDPDMPSVMIYLFLILITGSLAGWLAYEITRNSEGKISHLVVNHRGIQFLNKDNKVLSEIAYQDLAKSENPYCKDVFSQSPASGKYGGFNKNLYVYEKDGSRQNKKKLINLEVIPLKNKYDLIGHFLKGIQTFRQDLRIDSAVYEDFYLDEKTLCYNPESLKNDVVLKVVIIAIVILVLIFVFPLFE